MGKKYTTDEIEVGGHMLDASMMTSLDTVVTDSSSYFTTSGGTLTGDLTVDGNAIASGIGVGTSTIYSNSVNLNNSGTLRIGNAEFLAKAGNDLSVYQGKMRVQQGGKVLVGVTVNQTQSKLTSRQNGSSIEFGHLNQGGKYYGTLGSMSSSGSPFIAFSADNSSANTFTTRGAKGFVISQDTDISGDLIFSSVPLVNTANQGLDEKIRITSSGNIGIGTNNPGTKLHIGGGIITVNDGTGITYYEGTKINSYDANGYDIIGREGLTLSTVSADKDIILSPTGNVGIRTTNPGALLQVGGGSSYNTLFHTFDQYNEVKFHGVNNQSASGVWQFINDGTWNQTRFYVQDANNIASRLTFRFTGNNGANEILAGTSTGYVGIGTTSPGYKLHVNSGTINNIAKFESSDGGGVITVKDSGGEVSFSNIGNDIYFKTSSSQSNKMVILNSGNVGIGTTNPQAKLEVIGDVDASGFTNEEGGNKNRLLLPKGASYNGGGSQAGAIKITLPVLWTNTMMRITIKVFDYSTGESFDVTVGGYNYVGSGSGGFWVNTSAWISSQSDKDRNFTVRFGSDGSKAIVYIGELNSYWAYLKVNVIDVELNHNNTSNYWSTTSWAIGLESSSFQNVSRTHSNCQVNNWKRSGQDVYYASGTGNVGIGTTSPTKLLEVKSSSAYDSTVRLSTIAHNWDIQGGEAGYSSTAFALDYDGTTFFRAIGTTDARFSGGLSVGTVNATPPTGGLYVAGNVGIGTSSPQSKLHIETGSGGTYNPNTNHDDLTIEGSGNIGLQLFSPASSYQYIAFGDPDSVNAGYLRYYHGTNEMVFRTNGSDKMVIEDNGNVGIGTTSPAAKLHVNGEARVYGSDSTYYVNMNANSGWGYFNTNAPKIYINKEIQVDTGLIGSYNEDLQLRTQGSTKMYISNSNGNVGIGTTSPGYTLDVNGSLHSTNINIADGIYHEGDTNTYMQFHSSDQWRVVTGGTERLEVNNTQVTVANNLQVGGSIYASQYIYHTGDTNTYMRFPSNDTISWNTAGSERMRINSSGNIGIGTTAPSYKLHVTGTTYANGSVIGSSDLWLRDQSSAYSTELKMQNNTHTIGIDYQNNETLRFITRSGVTTVPITFAMRTGTINAATFTQTSDERLKTKISDLSCDNIDVSWKSFEMKDNEGEYRTGVVAQELEQKHPEFVNTNDEWFK